MPQLLQNYYLLCYVCIVVLSAFLSSAAIPSILHVARARHLYDDLGHFRKQHDHGIPRLGGVAIFVSFTITALVFSLIDRSFPIGYLLIASMILFAMGLKDDLSGVNSSTKFFIQFIVALILVISGNVRLTSMYGIFNIYELPLIVSYALSVLLITLIINAFNLIDGIDGLAGTTGIIANSTFALLFIYIQQYELAIISLIMIGSILGFLKYNLTPAKIFMGDTGSLFIGLVTVVMAIKFIELTKFAGGTTSYIITSSPALVLAVLIGPIFDTLRVFFIRIVKGVSPFTADRNHIHHRLLWLGLSHMQATLLLCSINVLSIVLAVVFSHLGNIVLIGGILLVCMSFNWVVTFLMRSKDRKNVAFRNLFT